MDMLPAAHRTLEQARTSAGSSFQALQVDKQATSGLYPADVPSASAQHVNIGFQREMAHDFVLGADFAYRHFLHLGFGQGIDLNRFNRAGDPVIPECTAAQRNDPSAHCSTGPIAVHVAAGRATYKGLLLRADKRFSRGFQALGSYAFSSNTGTISLGPGSGFDLDNWLAGAGPLPTDITHLANLAGVVRLPWRLEAGLNFSYSSAPPMSVYISPNDFNGDGTTGDLLPGTSAGAFNRGLGRRELESLVRSFNETYAGKNDPQGRFIRELSVPSAASFGDSSHSLDVRLTRSFAFGERSKVSLIGEVFNLYNAANLTGFTGDLTSPSFGRPAARSSQVFGSGGPRAFQLAIRSTF